MILVTGATGNIGSVLVRQLSAWDVPARALTRDAARANPPDGIDVVEGDLSRPVSLLPALAGVRSLFLLTTGDQDMAAITGTARSAGVRHVVLVSSLLAQTHPNSFIGKGALQGEQIVRDSGLSWTFLRPWEFASNALLWAATIREHGVVRARGAASSVIDPADIAAVGARVLTEPGHEGRIHPLTGPAPLTVHERVRIIARELGRELTFQEMTAQEALLDLKRFTDPGPTSTVEELTGTPARSFQQWVREHAKAFC